MEPKEKQDLSKGRVALAKMMTRRWILEHNKQVSLVAGALAILLVCLFSFNLKFQTLAQADYLKVQNAILQWSAQDKHDSTLFKKVSTPLSRHPELGAKFGAFIAQRLLSLGEVKLAQEYAQASLKRTKALLPPYYAYFSQNTLLVSQGRWSEALNAARQLKKAMENDEALWQEKKAFLQTGRALFAYNLLRIASLERQVGFKEGEITAWDEVLSNAGWKTSEIQPKTYDPETFEQVAKNFQNGDVSLLEYIEQRQKQLRDTL